MKQELIVKHRRKKDEIEKEFICGDPNCGRKYGTNAALYTHIKNKHNGVPPVLFKLNRLELLNLQHRRKPKSKHP